MNELIDEIIDLKENHLHAFTERIDSIDQRVVRIEVKLGYGLWGLGVVGAAAVVRVIQGFF